MVKTIAPKASFTSDRESYYKFSNIAPEPFTDTNGNGVRDPGECFTDDQRQRYMGCRSGRRRPGRRERRDAVHVTVDLSAIYFRSRALFGWSTHTQTITSMTLLKNQPYATQTVTRTDHDMRMMRLRPDRRTGRRQCRSARRLRRDRSGVALMEFALCLPIVLCVGLYGIETANLALINLRVSQIALSLADNASRVGTMSTLNTQQLREVDLNDVLQARALQGTGINLTTNGRIILSSLENRKLPGDPAYSLAALHRH